MMSGGSTTWNTLDVPESEELGVRGGHVVNHQVSRMTAAVRTYSTRYQAGPARTLPWFPVGPNGMTQMSKWRLPIAKLWKRTNQSGDPSEQSKHPTLGVIQGEFGECIVDEPDVRSRLE